MPPRRRAPVNTRPTVVRPAIPPCPCPPRKRKRDPYFPTVPPGVAAVYRKRRKPIVLLLRSNFAAHVVHGPLPDDWKGFDPEFAESLKASYAGRSYLGAPDYRCSHCNASFWYEERVESKSSFKKRRIVYNLCCKGGKVRVPAFTKPPDYLRDLMKFDGNRRAKQFIQKIRQYNCMFAFTSMGATIDRSVNNSRGPPIFKISGNVCHRMGPLLPRGAEGPLRPLVSETVIPEPKFCELYIYDTNNEVQNRMRALNPNDNTSGQLDEEIVAGLMAMLNTHNPLVQEFRAGRDRLQEHGNQEIAIRLIGPVDGESPQFSLPTSNELAALIVGDFTHQTSSRDIIIHGKDSGLKRINSLHPAYMSLQYPLLFTYAERGFQLGVPYVGIDRGRSVREKMTMQDYYSYVCHYRLAQSNPYLCYGLLSSQSVVDARACIDEGRLWFILKNQDSFRADNMQGITDAVGNGCIDGSSLGKKTVLPSSHTGGRRYFLENFQDGLAICRVHGAPDIFTTFTCNPKWPAITEALLYEPGQKPADRADIVVRVYHMKLAEYIADIRSGSAYGPVKAVLYTVEFQKRGLPHAHILVWFQENPKVTKDAIDSFVSAEIPDPIQDPLGYCLVSEFMMHGPCGEMNDKCVCMKKGACSKYFPKDFQPETTVDTNGFSLYRRRDNDRTVFKNGHYLDNRYVVPHNMAMLKKYQAHINVEWCNKTQVMKYLFKYVTKGPDFSKVLFQRINKGGPGNALGTEPVDEVAEYIQCRYICEQDAFWRIFGYSIHTKFPAIERLPVHLPDMNVVRFRAGADLSKIVDSDFLRKTALTEWFVTNRRFKHARTLTYCDFPTEWTWDSSARSWHQRGGSREVVGRVYYVNPTLGELYFLRTLLMIVKGATCFQDLRDYGKRVYDTFKEACAARGLLGDDNEWYTAFDEALVWGFGRRLRQLFVTMLIHCGVKDERNFFERYWVSLADDLQHDLRRALRNPTYVVSVDRLRDMLLTELADVFIKNGSSIENFNLPSKTDCDGARFNNRLIDDEMSYNTAELAQQSVLLLNNLNADQTIAYDQIMKYVLEQKTGFYFVSGFGGTGKTYLWNAICASLRGQGKIVLTVASSGVASLLLPRGRTAHSRFKIPIQVDDTTLCDIKRGTHLSKLLKETSLVIWDEALMTNRMCFEALDRSLRDVLSEDEPLLADIPFGGMVIVLGGDIRQILPVIEGGTRPQIVTATITHSPLWQHVQVLRLTRNIRLSDPSADDLLQREIALFSKWVLDLGEGKLPTHRRENELESTWITIPDDLLIQTDGNKIAAIVHSTYTDFLQNYDRSTYLQQRAILTPTNEVAEEINDFVLSMVPSDSREYLSADSLASSGDAVRGMDQYYTTEYLNAQTIINFPRHKLVLKEGAPIMLLRNLSQANGLCNGTRLIIKTLADRVIEAVIITGSHIGDVVYIPRIELAAKKTKWPFTLMRRQFPIRLCYAMTVNKSQGQTLSAVGLYLRKPAFTHGQLYVAVSRVTARKCLKILIENDDGTCGSETKNIVYPEMVIISSLDKLVKGGRGPSVSVYVSRLWHHRGGTDTGEIKHTDIVLLDSEGNHMYAEIWKDSVPAFINKIQEGHAYIISNFYVCDPKYNFRPVEARYMIKFTRYTTVQEQTDPNIEFPFCTYALTPLSHLTDPKDYPERFTDVLGQIISVSDAISYHTASRADPSIKRTIHIKDLAGHQISVVLWGEQATAFDGDGVIDMGKEEPVIALFVGTLVKAYDGRRGVSGSAACRWYINDDIPDVLEFKKRLQDTFSPIERMVLPGQTLAEVKAQVELETKTVEELLAMNPYDHQESRFFVCVTLTRLSPSQRWWFTSCSACHKTTVPYGTAYKCLNSICKGKDAVPRYRICFLATDDEKEAEFVFFDRVGRDIVGKPLISLLRAGRSSHLSVDEVVHSARGESSIPRELAALVSKKFRFVVSYSTKSYLPETLESSFQVQRIDLPLGSNSRSSSMYRKPLPAGASTSANVPVPAGSAASVSHGAVPPEMLSPSGPSLLDSPGDPPADASSEAAAGKDAGKSPASVSKKPVTRRTAKTDLAKPEIRKPLFPGDDAKDSTAQDNDVQDLSIREETMDPVSETETAQTPLKKKKKM